MKTIAPTLRRSFKLKALILATLLPGLSVLPVPLQANPYGPNVVAGGANFQGLGTANLNINQTSNTAIINWQGFSIANGEVTTFNQPGVNAVALNRVVSGNPSAIYGTLQANGSILVINPNGIMVGPGGVVDVAGMLTMSTLDIDDDDFLDGGSNRFQGNTGAGITNYGAVSSSSGDVVFLGNFLQNAGSVSAPDGTVAFGAGGDILVEQGISGATISVQGAGPGGAVGIDNSGSVNAAAVEFKTTGNAYGLAIQNSGVVRATGASVRGGRVMLSAGSQGGVVNTGQISARNFDGSGGQIDIEGGNIRLDAGALEAAGAPGMDGGQVSVVGNHVYTAKNSSINVAGAAGGSVSLSAASSIRVDGDIDATGVVGNGGLVDVEGRSVTVGSEAELNLSGKNNGGFARIGGGYQGNDAGISNADNTTVEEGSLIIADGDEGNGGAVIVWADGDTLYNGEISAQTNVGNGGFVEVSGKRKLKFAGMVDTSSTLGNAGTLLLDPTNVTIGANGSGADIERTALLNAWGANDVVIHTSGSVDDGEAGNIHILAGANLIRGSSRSISFFAHGDIYVDDQVQNNSLNANGHITMFAGWTGEGDFLSQSPINNTTRITAARVLNGDFGDWGQGPTGDIYINFSGDDWVAVGSRGGETNIFADEVYLQGGNANNRFAQIGYRSFAGTRTNATGDINVNAKSVVSLDSLGLAASNGSHTHIGHGGANLRNQDAGRAWSGDISVISGGAIVMRGGRNDAFTLIGHGGRALGNGTGGVIDLDGNINVEAVVIDITANPEGNRPRAFAQIGHGGYQVLGDKDGDINVVASQFIRAASGPNQGTNGTGNSVQIGHGGYQSGAVNWTGLDGDTFLLRDDNNAFRLVVDGDTVPLNPDNGEQLAVEQQVAPDVSLAIDPDLAGFSGSINVEATNGNIEFFASSAANGYAQIGHGGRQAHGNHNFDSQSGGEDGLNIVAGGDIIFDRAIRTNGNYNQNRASDNAYVQIGLGGWQAGGRFSGDMNIDAGGIIRMQGGNANSYAQIGHGGWTATATYNYNNATQQGLDRISGVNLAATNGHATLSGDITITSGGDFGIYSGIDDAWAYAMVGHGGHGRIADYNLDGAVVAATEWGHHGDISIDSGGSVTVQAKPFDPGRLTNITGSQNFAMVVMAVIAAPVTIGVKSM